MQRIIVGIDRSEHSLAALRWAAVQAHRHEVPLVAVFAWSFFDQGFHEPSEKLLPEFTQEDAQLALQRAIDEAAPTYPTEAIALGGEAAETLTTFAHPDDLLVVGARGTGGFKGLLIGSVSNRVLELASCPVAVIRSADSAERVGEIVVGIDGSDQSIAALRWALEQGRIAGERVRVVHAWLPPFIEEVQTPEVLDALTEQAARLIDSACASQPIDGLEIVHEVTCAGPAQALLAHDPTASMIVVASRGNRKLKQLLLGSTSRQIAHHATAPVVIVRQST